MVMTTPRVPSPPSLSSRQLALPAPLSLRPRMLPSPLSSRPKRSGEPGSEGLRAIHSAPIPDHRWHDVRDDDGWAGERPIRPRPDGASAAVRPIFPRLLRRSDGPPGRPPRQAAMGPGSSPGHEADLSRYAFATTPDSCPGLDPGPMAAVPRHAPIPDAGIRPLRHDAREACVKQCRIAGLSSASKYAKQSPGQPSAGAMLG